jgi:simple sugar transport system ATP-binding protein
METAKTTAQEMTDMMVGRAVSLNIDRPEPVNPELRLEIRNITVRNEEGLLRLDHVSFDVNSGEILGIAGISGAGQKELLESIYGLQKMEEGDIIFHPPGQDEQIDLKQLTPLQIRQLGVALSFVPGDRLGMGLVGSMDITDNMMLRSYRKGHAGLLDRKPPRELAEQIIRELEVMTPGISTPVRRLSGGNVQKVLVGREIAFAPKVLMAAYPVRGLDIRSSYTIYRLLNRQKDRGVAVIFVGEDLDVLLALCDRIMVMNGGRVTGIVDARSATKEEVGLMMTRTEKREEEGR